MQDARCKMQDARCKMQDARCKMQDAVLLFFFFLDGAIPDEKTKLEDNKRR
jgi:hypothetical protein